MTCNHGNDPKVCHLCARASMHQKNSLATAYDLEAYRYLGVPAGIQDYCSMGFACPRHGRLESACAENATKLNLKVDDQKLDDL